MIRMWNLELRIENHKYVAVVVLPTLPLPRHPHPPHKKSMPLFIWEMYTPINLYLRDFRVCL